MADPVASYTHDFLWARTAGIDNNYLLEEREEGSCRLRVRHALFHCLQMVPGKHFFPFPCHDERVGRTLVGSTRTFD
jgi:hypothetical protein